MPVYEFRCEACGELFERKLSVAERNTPGACPKCGADEAERVMSGFFCAAPTKGSGCAPTAST